MDRTVDLRKVKTETMPTVTASITISGKQGVRVAVVLLWESLWAWRRGHGVTFNLSQDGPKIGG